MADEVIYPNVKYRPAWVVPALVTWAAFYFAPAVLVGRFVPLWKDVNVYLGMGWMAVGALLLAFFEWKCIFPRRLVVDRDGITVEARKSRVALGWDKIHEARLEPAPVVARKVLGPVFFVEPLWPFQRAGRTRVRIVHAGPPIMLRADEFAGLPEFVETLKKRNVPGLADAPGRIMRKEFGKI